MGRRKRKKGDRKSRTGRINEEKIAKQGRKKLLKIEMRRAKSYPRLELGRQEGNRNRGARDGGE